MRFLARGVALALGTLLTAVAFAQPASAHALLVRSQPANGATLPTAPASVQLWFSEELAPEFALARLVDRNGQTVPGTRVDAAHAADGLVRLDLPKVPS